MTAFASLKRSIRRILNHLFERSSMFLLAIISTALVAGVALAETGQLRHRAVQDKAMSRGRYREAEWVEPLTELNALKFHPL
ncbi:hypothetical protein BD324DRAFT_617260 [Kockovaella imperatae]|uniref:Uncharacterized protein n=1 Tax=Kockovaella imperatae TaxID=4999 RepID=A0A1Y1URR2_9TREE|nr:hypothetical protein BD324DRAFT_617260 [Kockovaella imperatae]ORX40307.1 hypothetical protein BD324DRAFT_617260 [Kockovaella imperatae]